MSTELLFIGEFPPPYTGVTIKDSIIIDEILTGYNVKKFNLYDFKLKKWKFPVILLNLLISIRHAERICIGVGHPFRTCMIFRIARLFHGKRFQKRIVVFMMGIGTPIYLKKHLRFIPDLSNGKCIYTESLQLNRQLNEVGCYNAKYLPNFRKSYKERKPQPVGDVVKFVYFAQVRPEKGIETLIDATRILNTEGFKEKFTVSIYGSIVDGYKSKFVQRYSDIANVKYKGEFDSSINDVYEELNQYDSSSSSSSWREGMSGTNIECKFAGIANIVSNAGFNPECVEDGVDGLLVKPNDVDSLVEAMRKVIIDHALLYQLKINSFNSRVKYDVNNWKDEVINTIFT